MGACHRDRLWNNLPPWLGFISSLLPFCSAPPAPLRLSGLSSSRSLWARLGSFLYEHGEAFYHFQGLRAYKEKFHPQWESRYLVYPGGFRLPRILADVAAIVAGGYRKILLK